MMRRHRICTAEIDVLASAKRISRVASVRSISALASVSLLAFALPVAALTCHAVSAQLTRPLVELYTSEGCDSCPPADRWLSARFPAKDTNVGAIAIAFHVDYWDRLGWVDRFGSPGFTERQYAAMRANGSTFVYTPQVLLQGRDFAWQSGRESAIDGEARKPARATITVDVTSEKSTHHVNARAQVADAALARDARLVVAYTDSGHHSDVRAGENRGVRLSHDHVVRNLLRSSGADAAGSIGVTGDFARPAESGTSPQLVAFVQRTSNGDVLQTVSVPLDDCASR
jgi:hypothetical protein